MDYIQDWFTTARQGKTGYTIFSATALYDEVLANTPPTPFPVSPRKFGLELSKCAFIAKKKGNKHNLYSVKWD